MGSEKLRLFIAVPTPEVVKQAIAEAQKELRCAVPMDEVRWIRPEQFHLTLRFLGNVAVDRVEDLKEAVRGICQRFEPLELAVRGRGFFPTHGVPRVVWVGVNDARGRLVELWKALELATRSFSPEKAEEKFTGHITLARVNRVSRAQAQTLMKAAERLDGVTFGEWTASEVDLMRSELSSQGARHVLVSAEMLKGVKR